MPSKRIWICSLATMAAIVFSHIIEAPFLILACVAFICVLLLFADMQTATCLLFLFSPLSYILSYGNINLYIFLAVAYILSIILKKRLRPSIFVAAIMLMFCVLFADKTVGIKLGYLIYPILLLLVIFVCQNTDRSTYRSVLTCYTWGFIISSLLGLFKNQIPSILRVFGEDQNYLFIEGIEVSGSIQRYSGLSYDPNFFALIDCILIASILFTNKKLSMKTALIVAFLIIIGFFTYSKSYVILLAAILIFYILKTSRHTVRNLVFIGCLFLGIVIVQNFAEIEVLNLVIARFNKADSANALTTGRLDLWAEYWEHIFGDIKCMLIGEGFNALALNKAAHNTYIDFLYRFGILGSAVWFAFMGYCFQYLSNKDGIKHKQRSKMPILVCLAGFMFLSAFHFQQLWCCICIAMFATYMPAEGEICQA